MHFLVILTGKHKGRQIELPEREIWIGRDENCLVRMTSSEVSRRHCSLTPTGRGLLLRDLNSQNGTFVNALRVDDEVMLQSGDRLTVGPVSFEVQCPTETLSEREEDSVLGWLSEGDSSVNRRHTGDTTVIRVPEQLQSPSVSHPSASSGSGEDSYSSHTTSSSSNSLPMYRGGFASIAEEAADIFREWEEIQALRRAEG
jgi:pSer/pThr/pTyr-binding forkhead associated (FHA) protein